MGASQGNGATVVLADLRDLSLDPRPDLDLHQRLLLLVTDASLWVLGIGREVREVRESVCDASLRVLGQRLGHCIRYSNHLNCYISDWQFNCVYRVLLYIDSETLLLSH